MWRGYVGIKLADVGSRCRSRERVGRCLRWQSMKQPTPDMAVTGATLGQASRALRISLRREEFLVLRVVLISARQHFGINHPTSFHSAIGLKRSLPVTIKRAGRIRTLHYHGPSFIQ
jgi:hypothetical protein